jgi:hypothetical protein
MEKKLEGAASGLVYKREHKSVQNRKTSEGRESFAVV